MAWLALYSPWLSFWKPISLCMFSPWRAARVSTKGLKGAETKWERWKVNTAVRVTNVIMLQKQLTSQRSLRCRSQRCSAWFLEHDRTTSEWGPPAAKVKSPHIIRLMHQQSITFTYSTILSSASVLQYIYCCAAMYLIILIENSERPFIFRFGSELKILNVLRDNLSVCD